MLLPAVLADSGRRIHLILEEEYGAFIGAVCDSPIVAVSLPPEDFARLVPVLQYGTPACPAELARRWLDKSSKSLGIAPTARALLERVASAVSQSRKQKMSIEQALLEVAAAMRELAAAYSGETADQAATTAAAGTVAAEGEKRGRGRPRKGDAAAPAAAPATSSPPPGGQGVDSPLGFASAPPPPPPPASAASGLPPPPPTYTYEQVQRKLMEVDAARGRQTCVDLLSRYGATKLPEINPGQYTPFMTEMLAILTQGHDPAGTAAPNLF